MDKLNTTDSTSNHILIGLGGTGGKVLKAFRKRLMEEFPNSEDRNRLPLGYVYVDSSRELMNEKDPSWKVMGESACFTESEFVDIKKVDLNAILQNITNYPGLRGVVGNGTAMGQTLGEVGAAAGQKRRAGRILFGANCAKYISAINQQFELIRQRSTKTDVTFHIFTGLAGGTGSGSIVDAIAQIRNLPNYAGAPIMVYAMVPEIQIPNGCEAGRYQQNGYAALSELSAMCCGEFNPWNVISGSGAINLRQVNPNTNRQFSLMLYSNENDNNSTVDSFKELPVQLADMVYFRLFLRDNHEVTNNFVRAYKAENIPDYLIEWSEKKTGNERIAARTKAISTFGIKRIIYPERRILHHISYTVGASLLRQMVFNNFKTDFGFLAEAPHVDYTEKYINTDKNLRDWKLDDKHLMLQAAVLDSDDPKMPTISDFWDDLRVNAPTHDVAKEYNHEDPMQYLCQFYKEDYAGHYRGKGAQALGVEDFYNKKSTDDSLNHIARKIYSDIEQFLYTEWKEGRMSIYDLQGVCTAILQFMQKRLDKLEKDITASEEQKENINAAMSDLVIEYASTRRGLFGAIAAAVLSKRGALYAEYNELVHDYYVACTEAVAYEFAKKLLRKLIVGFNDFASEVQTFIAALLASMEKAATKIQEAAIAQETLTNLTAANIEVCENRKITQFEQTMLLDKTVLDGFSAELRKAITEDAAFAHFRDLADNVGENTIFDTFDVVISPKVREIHDQQCKDDKILGLNVLQQLQKVLVNDEQINDFARRVIQQSGTYLKLDQGELTRALANNANPVVDPHSQNRLAILITMPSPDGDDKLAAFAEKLQQALRAAFGNATPGSTIDFEMASPRKNELVVANIRFAFPMRCISWMKSYEEKYNNMVNNSNPVEANEARIMLHSESDGRKLPPLMGERRLTPDEMLPYFFVAVATGILKQGQDYLENKGWCISTVNKYDAEILTMLSPNFTTIITSQELTDERQNEIVDKAREAMERTMRVSEREELLERVKAVMRDIVLPETGSPQAPLYQRYAAAADEAMDKIKNNA